MRQKSGGEGLSYIYISQNDGFPLDVINAIGKGTGCAQMGYSSVHGGASLSLGADRSKGYYNALAVKQGIKSVLWPRIRRGGGGSVGAWMEKRKSEK